MHAGLPAGSVVSTAPRDDRIVGVIISWLLTNPGWVHRRVETCELVDVDNVRRRVSVDFTLPARVPEEPPNVPVAVPALPLSLLDKRVLRNLDVRDEDGKALPVLTTSQDAPYATAALNAYAAGVLRREPCEAVLKALARVTAAGREAAETAVASFAAAGNQLPIDDPGVALEGEAQQTTNNRILYEQQALMRDPYFPGLLRSLATDFLLLVDLADLESGERRIVKYSYEHRLERPDRNPVRWLAVRLGLLAFKLTLETPAATKTESYHCEMLPPPGLEFTGAHLDRRARRRVAGSEDSGGPGRAHLYTAQLGWTDAPSAVFYMRTTRIGFLRSALLTCLLTTALLVGGRDRLPEVATEVEAAATVLLLVPGLLAAYLSRAGEHALAASMLVGVRLMLLVSGLCAVSCGALLVAHLDPEDLELWWTALTILSTVALFLVSIANLLPLKRYG